VIVYDELFLHLLEYLSRERDEQCVLQRYVDWMLPRPTQPPTLSGMEKSTGQSAVMLCGWGVKAGMVWFIPLVDKRVGGR